MFIKAKVWSFLFINLDGQWELGVVCQGRAAAGIAIFHSNTMILERGGAKSILQFSGEKNREI